MKNADMEKGASPYEKLVERVMSNDNVGAKAQLEAILAEKVARRIKGTLAP